MRLWGLRPGSRPSDASWGLQGQQGPCMLAALYLCPKGLHFPPAGLSDPGEEVEHRHGFLGTGNKSDRVP